MLFQEGGSSGEYGLASLFSFRNEERGLVMHDLTPTIPWLRAYTHFPFRPMFGQNITLALTDEVKPGIQLTASDESYQMDGHADYRPAITWKYNGKAERFERVRPMKNPNVRLTEVR